MHEFLAWLKQMGCIFCLHCVAMLWTKSFHIVFVASWFAGLFYLPRIYVNLAMCAPDSVAERARLLLMARKLLRFMTILAVPALTTGLLLWVLWWRQAGGWLHAKMLLVVFVVIYHIMCAHMLGQFERGENQRSHTWFRFFNEIPVVLMLLIVLLAVIKPW